MKPKINILSFWIFIIVMFPVISQTNSFSTSENDSISIEKLKLDIHNKDSEGKIEAFTQLTKWFLKQSQDSVAANYAGQILDEANLSKNEIKKGEALFYLGISNFEISKVKALEFFKEATNYLENAGSELLADIYFHQSNIYTVFSEFPEALNYGLKSLEYNKAHNLESNILRDMSFIGYIHDRMYEFEESIKWNRGALVIAKQLEDKKGEALCYGRMGIAFDELAERDNFNKKLFDSALYYNLNAARLSETYEMHGFARTTYSNIGNTYSKLKNFDKAEEFTLKSLAVPGFEANKGVTLVNLGKIYLETGRYEAAQKILDSAMNNTIKYGTKKYQLEAYYRIHELDVKTGNYKNALQNYISYKAIEDELLNETKTKQIAEMSERYKTADKEREILIQRAELAEKAITIQNQNAQVYGLIGLSVLLSFIGYLFYSQQKLKNRQLKKENELKDALLKIETQNRLQEQRLRISRDLHDNIGAQLTFIISSIDNLKYGFELPEKLNNKLETISEFTTATIYELRDTIWAMNKDNISVEDFESRISNFIDKANLSSNHISFDFTHQMDDSVMFSSITGMNLYRIIQEAVNNALKYSEATEIRVHLEASEELIKITIYDNGIGFDTLATTSGNGLQNMKKRAQDINASFSLKSAPNTGTSIEVTLTHY